MNKSNTSVPVNLLNRLKISHSLSNQANKVKNLSDQQQNNSSQNGNTKNKVAQNVFYKVPRQTLLEHNVLLPTENNKNFSNQTTRHNLPIKNHILLNKNISRPFSTYGRFLSTPSGCDNQQFIAETCQRILTSKIKNIVIMTGAGISCPSGIPDFRSPGTGLYDNLKQYKIPYPEAIFDIDYFITNPKPFYVLAKEIFPSGKYRPNRVHYFFKLLQNKRLLHRIYTQNIDGLERLAGINDINLVEAHGTFASASCVRCRKHYSAEQMKEYIDKEEIFHCSQCRGYVKPDIVFFGEDLPSRFHLHRTDFSQADLLFVMGTSLEVEPFASIVDSIRFGTPRILLNREAVGVFRSKRRIHDNCILGDITESIDIFVKTLRWEDELEKIMKEGEEQQIDFLNTIKKTKPSSNTRSFSTIANNGRFRPKMLPPLQSTSLNKAKKENIQNDSSEGSLTSSSSSSSFSSDS